MERKLNICDKYHYYTHVLYTAHVGWTNQVYEITQNNLNNHHNTSIHSSIR